MQVDSCEPDSCWDPLPVSRLTLRGFDGPRHCASADDAGSRIASQVWNAPAELASAPYQVSTYVVKPRSPSNMVTIARTGAGTEFWQQRTGYFDMIK